MKEICTICKKEFEGSRAKGALRLHMLKKHGEGNCSHANLRMLNPNDPTEARAIGAGYAKYCPDCDGVVK